MIVQPRTSVYVTLPSTVHEAEASHLPLTDPTMLWRVSFWSDAARVTDDASAPVAVKARPPQRQSTLPEAPGTAGLAPAPSPVDDRTLRFDLLPEFLHGRPLALQVELVHGGNVVAYSTTAVLFGDSGGRCEGTLCVCVHRL